MTENQQIIKTMKNFIKAGLFLIACMNTPIFIQAQDNSQQLVVPLSDPAKPGSLDLSIQNGSITVTGYGGKDVIINVSTNQKKLEEDEDKGKDKDETHDGLKKISNNSIGLSASEDENTVKVVSTNWNKSVDLEIQVPRNFNVKLRDINDGDITVDNVNGSLDVGHVNGSITLTNISGSAVVNTTNGDIKAGFIKLSGDTPMAFSTFNGDIDVTLPPDTKANLKMKSDQGDIYTDFDMAVSKTTPKVENKQESGEYKISMESWVDGAINGGGPTFSFKNFNGDILIRKKKS